MHIRRRLGSSCFFLESATWHGMSVLLCLSSSDSPGTPSPLSQVSQPLSKAYQFLYQGAIVSPCERPLMFHRISFGAFYENLFTIHGNIITTFNLLRAIAADHGIQAGTGALRRRIQVIDCTNKASGYIDNCRKPSCKTPKRFCDGSFNYEYISQLEGGENHDRTIGCLCIKSSVAHTINLPI